MPVSAATDAGAPHHTPGGGKSFDYQDYWDGEDLIYTGRGQVGDQRPEEPNLVRNLRERLRPCDQPRGGYAF